MISNRKLCRAVHQCGSRAGCFYTLLHAGAVDEALNVLGFGRTPTVGEVCFVAASADTSEDLSELAHVLFRRGATRIRVIDVCVAALCYGLGREASLKPHARTARIRRRAGLSPRAH